MGGQDGSKPVSRGRLAKPLEALVFLLPLILIYEYATATRTDRVVAEDLLHRFLELFGPAGLWAPGLLVVVVLLATQFASGESWSVSWKRVGLMYIEAPLLAIPLIVIKWFVLHAPTGGPSAVASPDWYQVALGLGAGVYEELVFRLVLISVVVIIGVDLLRLDRSAVAVVAVLLSALAFAGHHHVPFGSEPIRAIPFLFRSLAGAYLALIFWYRGYGPAAGCHAAYNTIVSLLVV